MAHILATSVGITTAIIIFTTAIYNGQIAYQQSDNSFVLGVFIGGVTIAFTILIVIVFMLLNRVSNLQSPPSPQPQADLWADRPTLQNIAAHAKLFMALRSGLSRDESFTMAFALNSTPDEWGGDASKSKIIRDIILNMDRSNRIGEIYIWLTMNRPDIIMSMNQPDQLE